MDSEVEHRRPRCIVTEARPECARRRESTREQDVDAQFHAVLLDEGSVRVERPDDLTLPLAREDAVPERWELRGWVAIAINSRHVGR